MSYLVTHEVPHHHLHDHAGPPLPALLLLLLPAGDVAQALTGLSLGRTLCHHWVALPLGGHLGA